MLYSFVCSRSHDDIDMCLTVLYIKLINRVIGTENLGLETDFLHMWNLAFNSSNNIIIRIRKGPREMVKRRVGTCFQLMFVQLISG